MSLTHKKRTLWIVVGTRPNFIKVTRFKSVAATMDNLEVKIVHTGQHYDEKMAAVFFDQFGLRPDVFLNIQPDLPGKQIAATISALTDLFLEVHPGMVMVVGDVNSTLAAAVAANKCNLPIAHLESGLRSFDAGMPEEHNRNIADMLANLHFVTEDSGLKNLRKEGKAERGIAFVGNTMIDTLVGYRPDIEASTILKKLECENQNYALVTLHRPSNVDSESGVKLLLKVLNAVSELITVVFPIHPRSRQKIDEMGLSNELESIPGIKLTEPLGYFDFQKLIAQSQFVLTDSGGIQEETTFLRKPCLTLRPNTERPSTIEIGTNVLLPFQVEAILPYVHSVLEGKFKKGRIPHLWDGHATERVLARVTEYFENDF